MGVSWIRMLCDGFGRCKRSNQSLQKTITGVAYPGVTCIYCIYLTGLYYYYSSAKIPTCIAKVGPDLFNPESLDNNIKISREADYQLGSWAILYSFNLTYLRNTQHSQTTLICFFAAVDLGRQLSGRRYFPECRISFLRRRVKEHYVRFLCSLTFRVSNQREYDYVSLYDFV